MLIAACTRRTSAMTKANEAMTKAIKNGAKEKFVYLKSMYNTYKDNPQVHPNSLKCIRAEIDITAGIWNHDKALFDKGMRNYKKAMVAPPSPALDEEATRYVDELCEDDGQIVQTRTIKEVQLSEGMALTNMRNKESREAYEETQNAWQGLVEESRRRVVAASRTRASL